MKRNPRYPDAEEVRHVLINPVIAPLGEEMEEAWEDPVGARHARRGAALKRLALPGLRRIGNPIDRSVEGSMLGSWQHECDHLDGILYPMRIRDMSSSASSRCCFPDQELIDGLKCSLRLPAP